MKFKNEYKNSKMNSKIQKFKNEFQNRVQVEPHTKSFLKSSSRTGLTSSRIGSQNRVPAQITTHTLLTSVCL